MQQSQIKKRSNSSQAHKKQQVAMSQNEIHTQKQQQIISRASTTNKKQKITLGVCAMKKKVQSKPMKQILSRLACKQIQILQMWQYLTQPFEQWPKVQALICFHSDGFPFVQAWRYVKKHKPFLINNLDKQQLLWDRTAVYDILKKIRVPVAKHFMVFRDKNYIDQIQMRGNGTMWGDQEDCEIPIPLNMKKTTTINSGENQRNSDNNKCNQNKIIFNNNNTNNRGGSSNNIFVKQQQKQRQSRQQKQRQSQQQKQRQSNVQKQRQSNNVQRQRQSRVQKQRQSNQQLSRQSAILYETLNNYRSSIIDREQQKDESNPNSRPLSKNHSTTSTDKKLKQKRLRSNSLLMQENMFTQQIKSRKSIQQKKSISKNGLIFRKRSQVQIIDPPNRFPNALRSFHEKRLQNIDDYTIQQIDDGVLIKSSKTDKVHKLKKPFVQKPFDSQNHNICIYYPQNMGGGRKMLFRKIKDSCSQYQPNQNNIRTDRNYIYEEYLPTNAFDIKVYTIGPYYMYAEARRSPTLDGVVQRDNSGKEKRFPVILTPQQKFLCSKIVQQFQQEVCGFDLLRAQGKSYVCDVNGWSFVKGNPKYWDDCAIILRRKIFKNSFHIFITHKIVNIKDSLIIYKINIDHL